MGGSGLEFNFKESNEMQGLIWNMNTQEPNVLNDRTHF